jgi:phospholipid N-methyltransferase
MTHTFLEDLKTLNCKGNTAYLPKEQLNNYAALKKALIKANGKYNKNKFEFPYPAQPIIEMLMSGKIIDFKKEFQFFATPKDVAKRIVQDVIFYKEHLNVLEPSAGHGALIKALIETSPVELSIDAVELSELNHGILKSKYPNVRLFREDFLSFKPEKQYDLIIANPPFSKNQDIDHIKHMYSMLEKGGQLLTIASNSWTFGQQKKQVEFRDWLDEICATWIEMDKGVFKASGTMVQGIYINISK